LAPERLTRVQLNRATLARQMLLEREKVSAVEAVERLAGMQAQEARHPFNGLWSRIEGFRREDLHDALTEGRVVRATAMRATLHLLSARDYGRFRAPLQPVMADALKVLGSKAEGLEPEKVVPVARELLESEPRSFNQLRPLLAKEFPGVNDRALGYGTRLHLPLVVVPTDDRWAFPSKAVFAPAEGRMKAGLSKRSSPKQLLHSYLAAFGPASAADAATWSGLKSLGAELATMGAELATFEDEKGRTLYDLPDAPRPEPEVPAPVRLLPEFDNLVLAHADRTRLIAEQHKGRITTKNLRVRATFLVDGMVAGTWKLERKGKRATLRLEPFGRLGKADASELTAEAEGLLAFAEEDASTRDVVVVKA
jgi:hypothetical protein